MVELACSTTLAPAYTPEFFSRLLEHRKGALVDKPKTIVFIICGGTKISLDEMGEYQATANSYKMGTSAWTVSTNGKELGVPF